MIPWRRTWLSTPVFLPREFHRQEPGELQSLGLQRVRHDWATLISFLGYLNVIYMQLICIYTCIQISHLILLDGEPFNKFCWMGIQWVSFLGFQRLYQKLFFQPKKVDPRSQRHWFLCLQNKEYLRGHLVSQRLTKLAGFNLSELENSWCHNERMFTLPN